jgi:hypothetical protein
MSKFWLSDPCILLTDFAILPTQEMTKAEKMNALTRLALIITGCMFFAKYKHWKAFGVCSILLIILVFVGTPDARDISKKAPETPETDESVVENFSIVPTYLGTDFNQTIVSPMFSEEWQIPPPAYDQYTQAPYTGDERDTFEMPLTPQSYPYGQYMTTTNLLPSDEYYIHMGCGGTQTAREYANSTFLRHDLANRENMTRLYKKSLARRFRHNTQDTYSPYHSY